MFSSSGGVSQVLVTETFTASRTWTAPATTSRIEAASGKGAAGYPGTDPTPVAKTHIQWTFIYRQAAGGASYETNTVDGHPYGESYYCDPTGFWTPEQNATYQSYQACYEPFTDYVGGSDPTTGAPTTAFGKTFPGGTGGGGSVTNYSTPFAITPGGSYSLVIPDGGSLTISYYK